MRAKYGGVWYEAHYADPQPCEPNKIIMLHINNGIHYCDLQGYWKHEPRGMCPVPASHCILEDGFLRKQLNMSLCEVV